MNPSTPPRRFKSRLIALDFSASNPSVGRISGCIRVLDRRDGSGRYVISEGRATLGNGDIFNITDGCLEGVSIDSPKPGAPRTKAMRDVAVYLAYLTYLAGTDKGKKEQARARANVLALWEERGWTGFLISSHVGSAIKRGKKHLEDVAGPVSFACIRDDGPPFKCSAFAAKPEHLTRWPAGGLLLSGQFYLWQDGMENAVFGRTSKPFVIPIE